MGFLGVDVFFVISGYVISQLMNDMDKERPINFLINFWARRIRRLFPALFAMVSVTATLTYLLTTTISDEVYKTGAFALLGVSNLYLLHVTSDYFGLRASQNPFTHTWSLGVEEQFYITYALFFIVVYKVARNFHRIILYSIILLTIISILLNTFLSYRTDLSFYGTHTRFWELGLGCIAYYKSKEKCTNAYAKQIRLLAVPLIMVVLFIPNEITFISQLIVTLSTAIILYYKQIDIVSRSLSWQLLVELGVRSYSIYLSHWPILVISNYLLGFGIVKNLVCLIISILLSSMLYSKVELPFRINRFKRNSLWTFSAGLVCIFISSGAMLFLGERLSQPANKLLPTFFGVEVVPEWVRPNCSGVENIKRIVNPIESCLGGSIESEKKFVFLIGDSHADHLIGMVKETFDPKIYDIRNLNMADGIDFPFTEFNNGNSPSLEYLKKHVKSGDIVILAFHRGWLNPTPDIHINLSENDHITAQTFNLIRNLNTFSKSMAHSGVKIILVKDTPLMRSIQTVESCVLQRRLLGRDGCEVTRKQDEHTRFKQAYAFDAVAKQNPNVLAYDPMEYIYRDQDFFGVQGNDGSYLMFDWNHITQKFSRALSPHFRDSIAAFVGLKIHE